MMFIPLYYFFILLKFVSGCKQLIKCIFHMIEKFETYCIWFFLVLSQEDAKGDNQFYKILLEADISICSYCSIGNRSPNTQVTFLYLQIRVQCWIWLLEEDSPDFVTYKAIKRWGICCFSRLKKLLNSDSLIDSNSTVQNGCSIIENSFKFKEIS